MKTFIRTIIALFAICTFASCANDDLTTEITTEKEEVSINLIVSLGQEQTTRAAVSGAEDAVGNEYNINIDAKDIQLLLYKGDGSYFTKATVTTIRKVASEHNKYIIEGKFFSFSKEDLNKAYKLVVTANTTSGNCKLTNVAWQTNGDESEDYKTLRYDYSNGETFTRNILNSASEGFIPMWGNKAIILNDGESYEVKLLRAMAKVTVCLEKGLTNNLQSVKLTSCNNAGMMTPKRAATFNETPDVTSTNGSEELNVPNDVQVINTAMQFTPYEKNGYNYYCLYIPEQAANADSKIVVTIDGEEYELRFANYDASHNSSNPGERYPVLRNNWYNYVINSVSPKGLDLNLKYYVADWNPKTATDITFD